MAVPFKYTISNVHNNLQGRCHRSPFIDQESEVHTSVSGRVRNGIQGSQFTTSALYTTLPFFLHLLEEEALVGLELLPWNLSIGPFGPFLPSSMGERELALFLSLAIQELWVKPSGFTQQSVFRNVH